MKTMLWTKKQQEYIDLVTSHPMKYNFQWGATGTGKTYTDIRYLIPHMLLSKRGQEGLNIIGGVSEGTVKRNILEPLADFWGDKRVSTIVTGNKTTMFGETVYILGAEKVNQVNKFQGATIKTIFCDEVAKWNEEVFNYIHTRLRSENSQLFATFNPENPDHFIHKFIENDMPKNVVHSNLYDNTFLSPQTIKDFEAVYPKDTVYYTRFVLGLPCRAEGLVFQDFADNTDEYYADELPERFRWCSVGYDLGGNKSNYALVASALGIDGVLYVLKAVEIEPQDLRIEDVEKAAQKFIEGIEEKYNVKVKQCYVDDNYYTTINGLNDWRYIFDTAAVVKSSMPLEDRPIMLSKLMAQGRFKVVKGECEPLVYQLQNAVFDDNADKAVICDDGSMNIDEIDAFFYSIADNYHYLT